MANDFAVVSSVNTRFLLGPCIGVFELIADLRKRQYTRSVRMFPADRQTAVASDRDTRNEEVDEMTDTQVTWLTQDAHDRLKAELDQLIANRPVIAAEINDRREEGDLRENGGYHAARDEQGQQEARIRQLQELLNNAKVGEAPKQSGVALPGSVVTVYYDDDKSDKEKFLIATRQEGVSDGKLEVYSPNSPLGGALIDAKVGETRSYTLPNGKTAKVTLVSAEPYHS
jgi:transcription elongation factor GreA